MKRHRTRARRQLGGETGDPLDGLVNLFDLGIVLAVAFLIAGPGLDDQSPGRAAQAAHAGRADAIEVRACAGQGQGGRDRLPPRRRTADLHQAPGRRVSKASRARVTKLLVLGALAVAALLPGAAAATPPWTANQGQLDKTVSYMRGAQNADGGFGGAAGQPSDPLFSAWVVMALAAAGINPKDQHVVGGIDAYTYVTAHADALSDTTDFERAMLVAVASGTSPRDFGGRDLIAAILTRRLPDGSFTHAAGGTTGGINDTAFAMLAAQRHRRAGQDGHHLPRRRLAGRRAERGRRLVLGAGPRGVLRHDRRGHPSAADRAADAQARGGRAARLGLPARDPARRRRLCPDAGRPGVQQRIDRLGACRRCGPRRSTRPPGDGRAARRWTTSPRCSSPTDPSST